LTFLVVAALLTGSLVTAADLTMVVCAPGYPGSTAEAEPAMAGLAEAITAAAGWRSDGLAAEYFETEEAGLARLRSPDAGLTLVTLPFFLEHREKLALEPALQAVPEGLAPLEPWSLVAGNGAVETAADLDGWTLVSLAGHSPRFVRSALARWGSLPPSVEIVSSRHVLSSLRKAARGEPIVLLLDAEQAAAITRLPFADDLEVVHVTDPLPVSVFCAVGDRVTEERLAALTGALESLDGRETAGEALSGVKLDRFEVIDLEALERAETAFDGVAE
jgi:hypothetical protein